jgi:hypothetical protein
VPAVRVDVFDTITDIVPGTWPDAGFTDSQDPPLAVPAVAVNDVEDGAVNCRVCGPGAAPPGVWVKVNETGVAIGPEPAADVTLNRTGTTTALAPVAAIVIVPA